MSSNLPSSCKKMLFPVIPVQMCGTKLLHVTEKLLKDSK